MKKIATIVAVLATLAGNGAYAQNKPMNKNMGNGAQAGTYSSTDSMAWGVGLVTLGIVAAVVAATVTGATSSSSSFSH